MTPPPAATEHTRSQIVAALLHPAVVVGALGYFVDIYDLILFAVVRIPSLKGLGFTGDQLLIQGTWLINWQMGGMLLGGILWGLLGDRFGRLKVLFGSIILYSLANIANGLVHDLNTYAVCRFLAGLGLAGELGGCITLVSEVLPRALRGYGTMTISAVGILGAVAAGFVGTWFDWRVAYYVGGALGILLLFLRMAVSESGLFRQMKETTQPTFGSQLLLLASPARIGRYLCCIVIGLPNWYFIGIVVLFSPEFAKALGTTGPITAPTAVALSYAGLSLGSLLSGVISQALRSRKKVLLAFILAGFTLTNVFFLLPAVSPTVIYALIFILGLAFGYWSIFVTVAAEHFGTNMRSTVATTVPNFARGSLILSTTLFTALKPHYGPLHSALAIGWLVTIIALLGWFGLRETFHDDLDYLEK
jgi:MFS transporter, putative metabolite:H+ symporter